MNSNIFKKKKSFFEKKTQFNIYYEKAVRPLQTHILPDVKTEEVKSRYAVCEKLFLEPAAHPLIAQLLRLSFTHIPTISTNSSRINFNCNSSNLVLLGNIDQFLFLVNIQIILQTNKAPHTNCFLSRKLSLTLFL